MLSGALYTNLTDAYTSADLFFFLKYNSKMSASAHLYLSSVCYMVTQHRDRTSIIGGNMMFCFTRAVTLNVFIDAASRSVFLRSLYGLIVNVYIYCLVCEIHSN